MGRDRSLLPLIVGALVGLLLTGTLVVRTTQAMFTGTTSTATNSWATGGAAISNDASATAVFDSVADGLLTGGQTLTKCILVTYIGSTTATGVRLYGTASGALAAELSLTVDMGSGTGGALGSCAGFTATPANLYTGTLGGFATATASGYAAGLGTWTPAANATMMYRFTITVPNTAAAQNATASAVFTWEAHA